MKIEYILCIYIGLAFVSLLLSRKDYRFFLHKMQKHHEEWVEIRKSESERDKTISFLNKEVECLKKELIALKLKKNKRV